MLNNSERGRLRSWEDRLEAAHTDRADGDFEERIDRCIEERMDWAERITQGVSGCECEPPAERIDRDLLKSGEEVFEPCEPCADVLLADAERADAVAGPWTSSLTADPAWLPADGDGLLRWFRPEDIRADADEEASGSY